MSLMPLSSASKSHKAEAKFNVITDFPNLGLHSAAAKGNISLALYALTHGQPANSVLNGVLPLHAAASGGSELVVNLLLEHGADVNASRLPLKYSHEKSKSGGTIVGSSGSTPLHFAAANGHLHIVRLLLARGAEPSKADKHGVKAEDLAAELGHESIVSLLRASDSMRSASGPLPSAALATPAPGLPPSPPLNRILKVQRSIDNLLSTRKPTKSLTGGVPAPWTPGPLTNEPLVIGDMSPPPRRPSLPALFEQQDKPSSFKSHSTGRVKRPSSAGTGADQPQDTINEDDHSPATATHTAGHSIRKLGSKYSLMNLFKRGGDSSVSHSAQSSTPSLHHQASTESLGRTSSHANTSPRKSSELLNLPIPRTAPPYQTSFFPPSTPSRPRADSGPLDAVNVSSSPPKSAAPLHQWYRSRQSSEVVIPSPLAASTLNADDAGTELSSESEDEADEPLDGQHIRAKKRASPKPPPLPSILPSRGHHRRTSSQSARALRFDDPISSDSRGVTPYVRRHPSNHSFQQSPNSRPLRGSRSASSVASRRSSRPSSAGSGLNEPGTIGSFAIRSNEVEEAGEEAEVADSLGEPVYWDRGNDAKSRPRVFSRAPVRPRGFSVTSSSSSLSPALSPDTNSADQYSPDAQGGQNLGIDADSNRLRGGSLSSTSTDMSANAAHMSTSTSTSTTETNLTSPSPKPASLKVLKYSPGQDSTDGRDATISGGRRRPHVVPLVLRSVSNHAQARTLVEQTQREILNSAPDSPTKIPLSAQLAAYGETLQLERRFARGEAQKAGNYKDAADYTDSEDDFDEFGDSTPLGPRAPLSVDTKYPRATAFASKATHSLNRAASLDNTRTLTSPAPHHRTPSFGNPPSQTKRRPLMVSPSIASQRPRHRPIANMSTLQHKRSLDARLRGDDLEFDVPVEVATEKFDLRLRSDIEIIHTLPTPTDSPISVRSAPLLHGSSSEPPSFPPSPPTTPMTTPPERTTHSSDEPTYTHVSSAGLQQESPPDSIPRAHTRYMSSLEMNDPPRSVMGVSNYDPPSPSRSGKRFGFKHLVQTLKGKSHTEHTH